MPRVISSRFLVTLLVFTAFHLVPTAQGQITDVTNSTSTPIPGAGHDYIGLLNETVNPVNGSVSIRIQAPTPPGRRLSLPFAFAYDSNGGYHIQSDGIGDPQWWDNTAYLSRVGWSYSVPMVFNVLVTKSVSGQGGKCTYFNDYVFQDETGGRHPLYVALIGTPSLCQLAVPIPQQVSTGSDDYYQASLAGLQNPLSIVDGDGTTYTFPTSGGHNDLDNHYSSIVSSVEDRNGNVVTVTDLGTQHAGSLSVTDTLGRSMLSTSGFGSNGDTVTVSGFGNPYTVGWSTIATGSPVTVGATLLHNGKGQCITTFPNISGGGVSAIKTITLPNNTSYTFSYDTSYGLINQIAYPNGGYIKYVWGLNPLSEFDSIEDTTGGPNNCLWEHDTPAVMHRYVSFDGVNVALQQDFSYSTTWSATTGVWSSKTTTVTTTDKVTGLVDTKAYTYSAITPPRQPNDFNLYAQLIPVEQTIVVKDSTNKTLRTTTKAWFDQYELASEQTTLEDNATTSKTAYTYGSGAQVTEKDEYDWSTGSPRLLRRTTTSYQSFAATATFTAAASIFDRPCQTITYDGSGNLFAETDTFYDGGGTSTICGTAGTPFVSSAGGSILTGHDVTNYGISSTTCNGAACPRGNATTVIRKCFQGSTACTAGNPKTTYTYDETGQALSMTDPCGNGTCSDITGSNHITTYSFVDSFKSTNTGSFTTTGGAPPSGKVTNAYLTKITYPQTGSTNHIDNFTYGYNDGNLTTSIDEDTQTTTYRYNDNFDRPTETDYPDGGQTILSYSDAGTSPSVTTTKVISTSPSVNLTSAKVMDGMARVVQAQLTTDPDGTTFTAKTYDGHSRAYQSYNPTRCAPPTTNCGKETTWGLTTYTYDALGRTTNVADPDGSAATTKYSLNQATVTDEVGNQRTSTTDALGRLTAVAEAPTVSGYNWQTTYVYDPLNDLTGVTQNGTNSSNARVRTFGYDSLAQLLSTTNPESGTITYTYDLNGNVVTKMEPEANQTGTVKTTNTYAYDALNRLLSRTDTSPANANALYQYDGATLTGCVGVAPPGISGATNLIGRRSSMCSGFSASSFSYDPMGRTLTEARKNQGSSAITKTVAYTYYKDGSTNILTYPSGDVVTYTVGGAERVTQASDSANGYVGFSSSPVTYAPNGALAGMIQGHTSSFVGIATSNLYNDRLQPILLSAGISGGGSIFSLCYDFHLHQAINNTPCTFSSYTTGDNGNVFQVINNNDTTRSAAYIYDPLNRIAQAYTLNETSANCWGETYSPTATAPGVLPSPSNLGIDAWGNLTNRSGVSGMGSNCKTEGLTSSASTKNQLSILTYDAAGDVTNDGNGNQPTYDAEKRIATDAGFTYQYDADGTRMEKSSGTSGTMYWPGPSGEYLTETDLTGTINEEYIYFNGERIARVDRPSGAVHYYFSDHLQSASVITDALGQNPTYYYYYPYGGIAFTSGSDPNHYKFTGKERDSESGLDEFGARYYASSFGRFVTPDWSAKPTDVPYANFGNPQSLNLYSYVENNPTTTGDPDGHCCDWSDLNTLASAALNAFVSDNLLGYARQEQTTTEGKVGAAFGDTAATVTGLLEVGGGSAEALVTAPAGATGVGIVVPAVGVAVAVHGVSAAVEGYSHLFKSASEGAVDKSTPENQGRMSQGKAPLDKDGKPVELHHEGQTQNGPVKEMTQQEHRGGENFAKNHTNTGQQPSQINRSEAAKARRQHWKKQVNEQ